MPPNNYKNTNQDKRKPQRNPNGRQYPRPRPSDDFAKFESDEDERKETSESDGGAVAVFILHS